VWAYVWPLPFGATIPAFLLTFVVYLAVSWGRRAKTPFQPSQHLADAATRHPDAAASPR
jgi:hypothetical protein